MCSGNMTQGVQQAILSQQKNRQPGQPRYQSNKLLYAPPTPNQHSPLTIGNRQGRT